MRRKRSRFAAHSLIYNLSDADAREIAENVTGFFRLLLEWEAREKERTAREADDTYYAMSA